MSKERLIILDTTMRDGEQSPGASMTQDDKLRIAFQLEAMKVDIIEAGFAASSQGDFNSIQAVSKIITNSTVCSFSRSLENDIRLAGEALKPAKSKRIHTFIATSKLHMEKKLNMSPEQVIEQAVKGVQWARQYTDDVEFSAEDAVRSDVDFLCRVYEAVIKAGAKTVNIPDTVGYSIPEVWGQKIKTIIEKVSNSDKVIWATHCHNDLGLAVANSLSAILNGVRQIECTINGLGERAGNASLEEILMAVRTRKDIFPCDTQIDTTLITPISRLVSNITGFPVQPNKAIVGANAFAHESGIHQDGVLKNRETYEIMSPESVGLTANKIILGKLSGRNAFKSRLEALNIKIDSETELNQAFSRFKALADTKSEIFDEDLHIIMGQNFNKPDFYKLSYFKFRSESGERPIAEIHMTFDHQIYQAKSTGSGAVDASFKAIESIVHSQAKLILYSVNNITSGTDAQGEVTVRLSLNGRIVNGVGAHTDIVMASIMAYLDALNKLKSNQAF